MSPTESKPTKEQVDELRRLFFQKYENLHPKESFHPADISRIRHTDTWCTRFLQMNELDMEMSLDQIWETCSWRKQFGVNDITESNINTDYLKEGIVFARNKDIDGMRLLIFKTKLHTKGTKDMEEMMRVVVYWIERILRETDMEKMTVVFDMAGTGLSNMDLDFVKRIIDTFKQYYPNSLNYIIIYEMAWMLNAAFKLIKSILPRKALEILKVVTRKDITLYINKENCLTTWGGSDPYEFSFIPEKNTSELLYGESAEVLTTHLTVKDVQQATLSKKVHFDENPMDTSPLEQGDHIRPRKEISEDMLRLSPNEFLAFSKGEGSDSIVEINCISRIPVTYKIQTTSPEKFRVRPRCGILNPGETVSVNILLKTEHHLSETSKDKFLVMCIPVPQGIELTSQQMSEVWKHKQFNSPEVEQHRLTCVYKSVDKNRNGYVTDEKEKKKEKEKSNQETPSSINDVSRQANKLQRQLKFLQILQCTTIFFLLILSGAVIYLLRLQTASAGQDDLIAEGNILGAASCPMGRRL